MFAELALIILTTSAYHNTLAGGQPADGPVSGGQDQTAGTAKISEGTTKSFAVFSTLGVVPTQRFRQKAGCGWLIIFRGPTKTARNVQFVF
jgi:hypothetical protein